MARTVHVVRTSSRPALPRAFAGAAALCVLIGAAGCSSGRPCCDPCCPPCGGPVVPAPTIAPVPMPVPTPAAKPSSAAPDKVPTPALDEHKRVVYDGATGAPSSVEAFLASAEDANLIGFGELHGNVAGSELELEVLTALSNGKTPVALAMEFFERDTQEALDAYLAGTIPEAEFVKAARQNPPYARTHRPLIELCKAKHIPVIAANAPRRLVSGYRLSDKSFAEYRAELSPADRTFLPEATSIIEDRHKERFMEMMGPERGPRLFKSMALWDDSMADSIALFQAKHPDTRVMLIVGAAHVTEHLGTITKYLLRRPDAKVRTIVLSPAGDASFALEGDDRKIGDAVVKVAAGAPRP